MAADTTRRIVLATRNEGKRAELQRILTESVGDIEVVTAGQLGLDDVVEDGTSFTANALLKAHAAAQQAQLPAIADDSGLIVDILGAAPGILSARWAGRHGDDQANLYLLLNQLADVPDHARAARFECAAAFADPAGREVVRTGTMAGTLLREARGDGGFGYDPIFVPAGQTQTTAQMTAAAKNAISHRGKALRALAAELAASGLL